MKAVFSFRGAIAAIALAATTSFVLPATADDKKDTAAAKPVAKAVAKVRPLSITADLIGSTKLSGTLMDSTALEMRTSFGSANIPLSEVAGIRFASAENATTTVVMLNGDSITGATDLKLVTIETSWGTAAINGQNVESILFVPGLTWNSHNGLNGKRWVLSDNKASTSSTARTSSKASSSRSTASTSAPRSTSSRNTTTRSTSSGSSIVYPNNSVPTNFGR
ncbi:hypothetical protein [Stieleria marina]|uniref:Uncharacterized protein n=1 Tax=Stieleria marina TaxID=1930275 RepID=A0A517NVA6_9BACT|nr:hypothetical protein K239x_30530 [Planctomycetes bacterium K23_9]